MLNVSDLKSVGPNTAVPVRFRPRAPCNQQSTPIVNNPTRIDTEFCGFFVSCGQPWVLWVAKKFAGIFAGRLYCLWVFYPQLLI